MLSAQKYVIICSIMGLALPVAVNAASLPVAAVLPTGVVACNSYKNANDFSNYSKVDPRFADALLARADCFRAKEDMAAVTVTSANDYTSLKLLSGHRVWIPSSKLVKR